MADFLLEDAVERCLTGCCDLQRVRAIEADDSGDAAGQLWLELGESGFADALTSEAEGGAGLGLREAGTIAFACGRHALPVPLPLTMAVRASLADLGIERPEGAITVACSVSEPGGGAIVCMGVPYGLTAEWVLVATAEGDRLLRVDPDRRSRSLDQGSHTADLGWPSIPTDAIAWKGPGRAVVEWKAIAAALVAGQMAGAMERVAEMTIRYANERTQFGKPVGRFQAIQQQISVMAEHVFAARTSALFGLSGDSWTVDPLRAAVAKSRAGEAASAVAAIGHAVHGAIGVTAEFDLQMFTRRLYEWRGFYGGQGYWNRRLGRAMIDDAIPPLQFIQDRVAGDGALRGGRVSSGER